MRFLWVCFAMVLWASAPAGAGTPLRALDAQAVAQDFAAVGRLDLGRGGFCTGALVSPDVVLTAAHCLFDRNDGRRIPVREMAFHAGLVEGVALASRPVEGVVMHPGYSFEQGDQLDRVGADLALIKLSTPINVPGVVPFRMQSSVGLRASLEVVSYALGRANAPALEAACGVLTRDTSVLVLSCEVDYGASGAPVFQRVGDEIRIVSVVSAKADWQDRPVALAAVMERELGVLVNAYRARIGGVSGIESVSAGQ